MKLTVCQLPDPPHGFEEAWQSLCEHARAEATQVVVLPELIFHPWVGWTNQFDKDDWQRAVDAHVEWLDRLGEIGAPFVLGSRPITSDDGVRHNRSFVWHEGDVFDGHDKYYLPEEPGFWEASWYSPGDGSFHPMTVGDLNVGFMICTDMWFTEHARGYARSGVQLLVTPRATEASSEDKWLAGGRSAAVMAGAFGLSSNRSGESNGVSYAGMGWIVDPDGLVLAKTSSENPFVTLDVDLTLADKAKSTYPRYVKE